MNTTELLIGIGVILIVLVAYILKDTFTEKLSKGKSFAPNETKGFL